MTEPQQYRQVKIDSFEHAGTSHGAVFAQLEDPAGTGSPTHLVVQRQSGDAALRWSLDDARRLFADHPQLGQLLGEGQGRQSGTDSTRRGA